MGLRDWIVRKLGGVPGMERRRADAKSPVAEALKSHSGFTSLLESMVQAAPGEREDAGLQFAYQNNIWVYRCVSVIAQSCAQVPLRFYRVQARGTELEQVEVIDHPAVQLLQRVNDEMASSDLTEATHAYLALRNEAFWLLGKEREEIATIFPIRPDRVEIVPAKEQEFQRTGRRIAGYFYHVNGKKIPLEPDEVVPFIGFSPYDDWRATSPLQVAAESLRTDAKMRRYGWKFLDNDAEPGGVIEVKEALSDETFHRLQRQWEQRHRGVNKAGVVAILEGGATWKTTALSQRDMEFIEGRKLTRSEILALWGVPPIIAGIGDDAKYDSAAEQLRMFLEFNIAPRLAKHANQVTEMLLPRFTGTDGMFAAYDTAQVAAFVELELSRAERIGKLSDLTINERRALLHKPALQGGDAIYGPLALVPLAGEGVGQTEPRAPDQTGGGEKQRRRR